MATTTAGERRDRTRDAPSIRILFGLMVTFFAAGILSGLRDVIVPRILGDAPFQRLLAAVEIYGPGYLFLELFVHNLGVACLVPGLGLLLAHVERGARQRRAIGLVLLVGVALSLGMAALHILNSNGIFNPSFSLTLLTLEAGGVLALAVTGYRTLARLPPGDGVLDHLDGPMRELAPWFLASVILLAVGSFAEVGYLMRRPA